LQRISTEKSTTVAVLGNLGFRLSKDQAKPFFLHIFFGNFYIFILVFFPAWCKISRGVFTFLKPSTKQIA